MFNCRRTTNGLGDATDNYEIDCPKGATVSDFLDFGMMNYNKEFGDIHFGKLLKTYDEFRYSNFKDTGLIREKYGDRIIQSPIKCNGGWGRMDYWIELLPLPTLKITNRHIWKAFLESTKIDKNLIDDWRPCEPLYDVPHIPMAIVVYLKDNSKLIYIYKEEVK